MAPERNSRRTSRRAYPAAHYECRFQSAHFMSETGRNTNLASEFFVMSALYRLGTEPLLTLGNKKSVDIFCAAASGHLVPIEVKSVAGKHDWRLGSRAPGPVSARWIALICFNGAIADATTVPDCWLLTDDEYRTLAKPSKGDTHWYIQRVRVRDEFAHCLGSKGWQRLADSLYQRFA